MFSFSKKMVKSVVSTSLGSVIFYMPIAFGNNSGDLGAVAGRITGTLAAVINLVTAGAYLAGFALVVGALFKFKKHHEQQGGGQNDLTSCIVMLVVGVALIWLPSLLTTGSTTIFGTGATSGKAAGFNTSTGT